MTILNALRYGPLYSWSISPPKAKNMQEANQAADTAREEWEEEEQILHVAGRETAEHRGVGEAAWISLRDEDGEDIAMDICHWCHICLDFMLEGRRICMAWYSRTVENATGGQQGADRWTATDGQ
ncbi:hypothetical protein HDK64DRAFT_313914 [Phyllosticta capitalensis]